jgi:hypothetical protein
LQNCSNLREQSGKTSMSRSTKRLCVLCLGSRGKGFSQSKDRSRDGGTERSEKKREKDYYQFGRRVESRKKSRETITKLKINRKLKQ